MDIPYIPAKSLSYSGTRSYSNVYYIIIHYTGISNDTAENNCKYFATGNKKKVGAHFFVDQKGRICQSVKMSYTANSVPRKRQAYKGGGTLVGKCTSANSISIEMTDNLTRDPSPAQTEAVRQLIQYIQSVCPNARTIVRHYDVTGKLCPARMTDTNAADSAKWKAFRDAITRGTPATATQKPAEKKVEVEDLTKEETTKLIDKAMKEVLGGNGSSVSTWAVDEYAEAKRLGITDGTRPQGRATREEVAVMLCRLYKLLAEKKEA